MAIRFRKTFKIAPGVKLNVGKKSASVRFGGKNFGFTKGTTGQTLSASIPGTGLGVTQRTPKKPQARGTGSGPNTVLLSVGAIVVVLLVIAGFLVIT